MRPVLVALMIAANVFVVAALGIARPTGWFPPFVAFGSILVGFVIFEVWALRHRHDDE